MNTLIPAMAIFLLCVFNTEIYWQNTEGGSVVGKLKSRSNTPDGKNTNFEILAPGEQKPRKYHVLYDQKLKCPMPKVLEAVRAAKIGDIVEIEWQKTGHGPAAKLFNVVSSPKNQN